MEIELFLDGGQIKIKKNINHHMGAKTQAFDIFQTPLSSHYPLPVTAFSLSRLSTTHLIGFSNSCEFALAIETKVPLCFILPLPSPTIPEDDLP